MENGTFSRSGINNFRNTHVWSVEHPHAYRQTNFQDRFSVNI